MDGVLDFTEYGSSPRVRSRPPHGEILSRAPGIISACAEQTKPSRRKPRMRQDHLRVCGADDDEDKNGTSKEGSSPRVRSRQGAA